MTVLVVTTERLKQDVIDQIGIEAERVFVAGGAAAANYTKVSPTQLGSIYSKGYQVGYAGSALKGKGVDIFLACARLMPDVTFHLIGPDKGDCERLGGATQNVVLHGYQAGRLVVGLLKAMDVLLLPNQPSVIIRSGADIGQHTSPIKLFEYMAAGRPIIVSDLPVFDHLLADRKNSLRVPASDAAAFCRAIRELQKSPELASRLSNQAQRDFESNHTWNHRVCRINDFLSEHGIELKST